MKISILLPYKENYSPIYPGAVSIFINSVTKYSKYKENIKIYGNTELKKKYSPNYYNIPLKKKLLIGLVTYSICFVGFCLLVSGFL